MSKPARFFYVTGLLFGALALVCGICLTVLDIVAPGGSGGNTAPTETFFEFFMIVFILVGFVVFFYAIRALREVWAPLSDTQRVMVMSVLVATNFFGAYIFFACYPKFKHWVSNSKN